MRVPIPIRTRHVLFGGALLLLLVGGCAVWQLTWLGPVANDAKSELIFSHERHAEMEIECIECHEPAFTSTVAADRLLPMEATCMECYDREEGCELCHGNANAVVVLEPRDYGIEFPHEVHLKKDVNPDGCDRCHPDVAKSTQVAQTYPIRVADCRSCHESEMADAARCGSCHDAQTAASYLPISHDADWLARHATSVADGGELCNVCHRGTVRAAYLDGPTPLAGAAPLADHAQSADVAACADCHEADVWPERVHEDNFLSMHSLEARIGATSCESCHAREECTACHAEAGLVATDVHPTGFLVGHEETARQRLATCAACHEETYCLTCHMTTKPHPEGWDGDISAATEKVCRQCHLSGEPDD